MMAGPKPLEMDPGFQRMSSETMWHWRGVQARRALSVLFWLAVGAASLLTGQLPLSDEPKDPAPGARNSRALMRLSGPGSERQRWSMAARAHHAAGGMFRGSLTEVHDGLVWQATQRWRADGVRPLQIMAGSIAAIECREARRRGTVLVCIVLHGGAREFLAGHPAAFEPLRAAAT